MEPWLVPEITARLELCLAWKIAKDINIKSELSADDFSDDGSNLRATYNTAHQRILKITKWGRNDCSLTDAFTSIQARVTQQTRQQFQSAYGRSYGSLLNACIRVNSCEITVTQFGPTAERVQLILHELIPSHIVVPSTDIPPTPIHRTSEIQALLARLVQYWQSKNITTEELPQSLPQPPKVVQVDMGLAESTSEVRTDSNRNTPRKRPHSSPTRPSPSKRSNRPRSDDDVVVQNGINLGQPMQIAVSARQEQPKTIFKGPQNQEGILLHLLNKNGTGNNALDARAEATRLINAMAPRQMPPPPVPLPQAPLNHEGDDATQSQSLLTQIHPLEDAPNSQISLASQPLPDVVPISTPLQAPASPVISGLGSSLLEPPAYVPSRVALNVEAREPTHVNLPNATPTSAQPQPPQSVESSLPQAPPNILPSEPNSAIVNTSSSHVLEGTSSSLPQVRERAPSQLYIKYARKPVPEDQRKLLDRQESWWVRGAPFPRPNIPVSALKILDEAARQRAAKSKVITLTSTDQDVDLVDVDDDDDDEGDDEDQATARSWSTSPVRDDPPLRSRFETIRRDTNLPESSAPAPPPLLQTRTSIYARNHALDLPPDSSAEMGHDVQPGEQRDTLPSSPPESPVSSGSIDYGLDSLDDSRQLPEFPISSGESVADSRNTHKDKANQDSLEDAVSGADQHELNKEKIDHDHVDGMPDKMEDDAPADPEQAMSEEQIQRAAGRVDADAMNTKQDTEVEVIQDAPHADMRDADARDVHMQDADVEGADVMDVDDTTERTHLPESIMAQTHSSNIVAARLESNKIIPVSTQQQPPRVEVKETPRRPSRSLRRSRNFDWNEAPQQLTNEERKRDFMFNKLEEQRQSESRRTPSMQLDSVSEAPQGLKTLQDQETRKDREALENPVVVEGAVKSEAIPVFESAIATNTSMASMASMAPMFSETPVAAPVRSNTLDILETPVAPQVLADTTTTPMLTMLQSEEIDTLHDSIPATQLEKEIIELDDLDDDVPESDTDVVHEEGTVPDSPHGPVSVADQGNAHISRDMSGSFRDRSIEHTADAPQESALSSSAMFVTPRKPVQISPSVARSLMRTTQRSPSVMLPPQTLVSLDKLFNQMRKKHGYTGQRQTFENMCKKLYKLHNSSSQNVSVPLNHWDNFVVLQQSKYIPYAQPRMDSGEEFVLYDQYWRYELKNTVDPADDPILTPAKLDAIFSAVPNPPDPPHSNQGSPRVRPSEGNRPSNSQSGEEKRHARPRIVKKVRPSDTPSRVYPGTPTAAQSPSPRLTRQSTSQLRQASVTSDSQRSAMEEDHEVKTAVEAAIVEIPGAEVAQPNTTSTTTNTTIATDSATIAVGTTSAVTDPPGTRPAGTLPAENVRAVTGVPLTNPVETTSTVSVANPNTTAPTVTVTPTAQSPIAITQQQKQAQATAWLRDTFIADPTAQIQQTGIWALYKDAFSNSGLSGKELIDEVRTVFPRASARMSDEVSVNGNRVYIIAGVDFRPQSRPAPTSLEGTQIRNSASTRQKSNSVSSGPSRPSSIPPSGAVETHPSRLTRTPTNISSIDAPTAPRAQTNPSNMSNKPPANAPTGPRAQTKPPENSTTRERYENRDSRSSSVYDRSGRWATLDYRTRSRSPVRGPPPPPPPPQPSANNTSRPWRAPMTHPKGKQTPPLDTKNMQRRENTEEDHEEDFKPELTERNIEVSPALTDFLEAYGKLGRVTKKGNAFSELD